MYDFNLNYNFFYVVKIPKTSLQFMHMYGSSDSARNLIKVLNSQF